MHCIQITLFTPLFHINILNKCPDHGMKRKTDGIKIKHSTRCIWDGSHSHLAHTNRDYNINISWSELQQTLTNIPYYAMYRTITLYQTQVQH